MNPFFTQVAPTFAVLALAIQCTAQTPRDTLHRKAIAYVEAKLAGARPLNIEYSGTLPYSYSPKTDAFLWPAGKITSFSQLRVSSNLNLIKRKRWIFGVTFLYNYINVGVASGERAFQYQNTALNFTYFSKLFNKPVIYGASVMVDGSEQHFERVKGLVYGTMILKADARTKMTAGLIVTADPTSLIPVLPAFSYERRFRDDLMIDILLPKYLYLRKYVSGRGRLSLGTEFDGTNFYLYHLNPDNPARRYEYQQLNLNSGLTYEHLLGDHFIFSVSTGLRFSPSAKLFGKSSFSSPVFEPSPDPAVFFKAGLSFDPFVRRRKS